MPITFTPMKEPSSPRGYVFVSSSIPDPARWDGYFDALEITDAIVALARACLSHGYGLVTAAHPTIAPLLLYVAAEFPHGHDIPIRIYQSLLFEDVLPTATRRFEADGIAEITWTPAADGESIDVGNRAKSLLIMRENMLRETEPVAAVFVGGMGGIPDELALFRDLRPGAPTYVAGAPGGAASFLADSSPPELREALARSRSYPAVWDAVLRDLDSRG